MRLVSTMLSDIDGQQLNIEKIKKITDNDNNYLLHVYDVFSETLISHLIENNKTPKAILSDHVIDYNLNKNTGIDFYGLPLWLEWQRRAWNNTDFDNSSIYTDKIFNFIINKKQVNRYLLIKFVELFRLCSYHYTWSGIGREFDCSAIIDELKQSADLPLTADDISFLLAKINIPKKFFYPDSTDQHLSDVSVTNYGNNKWTWNNGINQVFSNSAVALISESVQHQKMSVFTEKTLYSVLGLNFPIWIGGYRQAESWKKIGFDTFDDVIDHSYQYHDTLIERCYWAFKNNLHILSDFDFAKNKRCQMADRLLDNRARVLNGQLKNYITAQISTYPADVQTAMQPVINQITPLTLV